MMGEHIVMYSGGIASWATAKRVAEEHGTENLTMLFADTKMEDEDLYRFLDESAVNVGGTLVKIAEGRTPWQVFFDVRLLGNSRKDPCSRILKRQFMRKWLNDNHSPDNAIIYIGFDWTERHRFDRALRYWNPWRVEAPMINPPILDRKSMFDWLENEGIRIPRLYTRGFPHNNCGGFCVRAGQANFAKLLSVMPERYRKHECNERAIQIHLGKPHTILTDRRGGKTKPLSMKQLREEIEQNGHFFIDKFEWGGCACMDPSDEEVDDG